MRYSELTEVSKRKWTVFVDMHNPHSEQSVTLPIIIVAKNPPLARAKAKKMILSGKIRNKQITLLTLQGYTEMTFQKVGPSRP